MNRMPQMPNNIMQGFQAFMQNPMQYMSGMNIPQKYAGDPNGIIQFLMDSGKINQNQYMQAKRMADQMQQMMKK